MSPRTPPYLWPLVALVGVPGVIAIVIYDWLRAGSGRLR